MANFENIIVGGVLKIKDASFLKDPSLIRMYENTHAVVVAKDGGNNTVAIKFFDGTTKWVKIERVTNTFEIME